MLSDNPIIYFYFKHPSCWPLVLLILNYQIAIFCVPDDECFEDCGYIIMVRLNIIVYFEYFADTELN